MNQESSDGILSDLLYIKAMHLAQMPSAFDLFCHFKENFNKHMSRLKMKTNVISLCYLLSETFTRLCTKALHRHASITFYTFLLDITVTMSKLHNDRKTCNMQKSLGWGCCYDHMACTI